MLKVQCGGLDMKGKMVKSLNMQVEMEKEVRKLKEENKSSYFELFFTVSQFYLTRLTRNTPRTGVNIGATKY